MTASPARDQHGSADTQLCLWLSELRATCTKPWNPESLNPEQQLKSARGIEMARGTYTAFTEWHTMTNPKREWRRRNAIKTESHLPGRGK